VARREKIGQAGRASKRSKTNTMKTLRFAILGTGFWARFQLAAWRELEGAECVALYNRTRSKAESLAQEFGVRAIYDDAEELFKCEQLDFADIISDVDTHARFVHLAARHSVPVICQKPMAPDLPTARDMVRVCEEAGVPLWIHENWRFQTPLRALKATLESGVIGEVFRARLSFVTSFPVFDNQPFLRELEQFILTDIGSHVLDSARFLFGEASTLFCQTHRVGDIRGEDVATVVMQMQFAGKRAATVVCDMSYASRTREERFPQTFAFVEGTRGSAQLSTDFWLHVTTEEGTCSRRAPPPHYAWADPEYDLVHASILPCNADILADLRGEKPSENRACDNLKTVELVFGAYRSAAQNQVVTL